MLLITRIGQKGSVYFSFLVTAPARWSKGRLLGTGAFGQVLVVIVTILFLLISYVCVCVGVFMH